MKDSQTERLISALEYIGEQLAELNLNVEDAGENLADAVDALTGAQHVRVRPGETKRVATRGLPKIEA
jgi:hypothetical protein